MLLGFCNLLWGIGIGMAPEPSSWCTSMMGSMDGSTHVPTLYRACEAYTSRPLKEWDVPETWGLNSPDVGAV